jgi:putative acetyltransferase
MTVVVRPIAESDMEGFRAVIDAVAREKLYLAFLEAPSIERTAAFVRGNIAKGNPAFVAIDAERLVGWCDITRNDGRDVSRHAGTLGIGLLAPYRGRGIGRRLMQAAIDAALLAGMTRIELTVRADNDRARRLYASLGFETEGLHRHAHRVDGDYHDVYTMALLAEF